MIQNSKSKLKAFIQASILDQELLNPYQIAKDIANKDHYGIPVSQIEVTKNYMGIPNEKVMIAGMYLDRVIVDFSYNNSDVTSSHKKYRDNGESLDYDKYIVLCNYYQDLIVEGKEKQHRYIIKLPDTLNRETPSSPLRLNLKIKSEAVPYQSIPYSIVDFAELNVTDIDSVSIQEGKRDYTNECYNKSISDLTDDSLEIQGITIIDSKGTKWSLSIGLVDYFKSIERQQIVLRMNNELYRVDSINLKLAHVEMDPNSFRYYRPDEQGLQIYHNQPINKNDIGLVDLKDKSILDFDMKVINDTLLLSHKNNTLVKVENWNTYQPARELMVAFNGTVISNLRCIVSACTSEDIVENFNKEKKKVTLLSQQLLTAASNYDFSKVKDLVNQGADINYVERNKYKWTALHFTSSKDNDDIVKFLVDRGANIKARDIYGKMPLHVASQYSSKLEIVIFLLGKDPRGINDVANDGSTLLHVAVTGRKLNTVKFLVGKGADIEVEDKNGYTPLELARRNGYEEIIEFLEQEQLGKELFSAIREFNFAKVEKLISQGGNIDVKDKNGNTPLDIARNTRDALEKESSDYQLLFKVQLIVSVLEQEQLNRKLFVDVEGGNFPKEVQKPGERRRRDLAENSNDQSKVATSGSAKLSSLINDLCGRIKGSIGGLISSVVNKFATKESKDFQSRNTGAYSVKLEKVYGAAMPNTPQPKKLPGILRGNISNKSLPSNQEKVTSSIIAAPEINTTVVNNALVLSDLVVRLANGTRYKQPIHENLLSPREQSRRLMRDGEDMIMKAIEEGKEKFGVPGTKMNEVEVVGNKTRVGR